MTTRPSQYNPGSEIPEKSWAYNIAKKIAFHEYDVYTKNFDEAEWKDTGVSSGESKANLVQIKVSKEADLSSEKCRRLNRDQRETFL